MNDLKKIFIIIFIPVVLFISIFLYCDLVPVNVMEARNFITAREMAAGGSWLLPTMNGELRIAKPPLPTWITAAFMLWAGSDANLVANRIPAGMSALLLALFTYLLVRRITGDSALALLSMLVLSTSYLFMLSARKNAWDIFSITFMTGAVWTLAEAIMRTKGRPLFLVLFSVLMACAFYSKGPVPFWVMLVPFLISYALAFGLKDLRESRWGLLWAFLLCAVLSAAWPFYVYLNTPHAAVAVASKESTGWFTNHTEPLWYYLLHFQEIVGIWVFFLLYGLAAACIKKDWRPQEKFFVFWFILSIVSITVFPEKKLRYLLPAVVPAAVVSAVSTGYLQKESGHARKIVYGIFCVVTGAAYFAAAGTLAWFSQGRLLLLLGVPMLAYTGAVLIYLYTKNRMDQTPLIAMAGLCLCLVFLTPVFTSHLGQDEARPFLHLRDETQYRGKDFFSLGDLPPEIIWASGRTIRSLNEQQLMTLTDTGTTFVLMTDKARSEHPEKLRLLETIGTQRTTYYIFQINPGT
ncbi:MAG: glycosyltransferase family 39 protein [Desulfobacterota bacterium]|nr:glycosyltransferase family 39 protein [Thermodesulfobacteriota bacterium]